MYRYKRGINNIETLKQLEYTFSDNLNSCLCLMGNLEAKKPYQGLYIKNGKIMVLNLIEKIELKDKVYKMVELSTTVKNVSCDEYITAVDLNTNTFEYDVNEFSYKKKFTFEDRTERLTIEYELTNKVDTKVIFKVLPIITYRDLFNMKKSNVLKFNQRSEEDGTVINLSVTNQDNIIFKSKDLKWTQNAQNLTSVKHEYTDIDTVKQIYIEDLILPGEFEISVEKNSTKIVRLYISCQNFNIDDIYDANIFTENKEKKLEICKDIEEEYIELKELAISIDNLNLDRCLVPSIPYKKDYTLIYYNNNIHENFKNMINDFSDFTDIIKSVDGQYLAFNKIKEAKRVLVKIRRYIKTVENLNLVDFEVIKQFTLLKLWYIESVNKVVQKDGDIDLYFDIVKDILYFVINNEYKEKFYEDIELSSLVFNGIKIYENMLASKSMTDVKIHDESLYIEDLINTKFWIEDRRILKRNINDKEACANVYMMYTMSLSYPCISNDLSIKLLDTIFKELYTPYGLRTFSKNSGLNDGLIYPKYMAHFVKANLRQNGVTRASQKIAYNLVKELIQDINKYVNGGIKKIYHEKGLHIDSIGYDLLTNAELIRLYSMLT